jgi:hypothetical protein
MSKSSDNGIWLDEPPEVQFGKLRRIPDECSPEYLRRCTDLDAGRAGRATAHRRPPDPGAPAGAGALSSGRGIPMVAEPLHRVTSQPGHR